ncbi:MAG: LysR family transcriptional regulator ArgP [Gordonia sp. (in: high G+C Gram-positive bacteria)]|uniref:LysR family transcriptional regulator ArgP n=1 Tax=Gordonia sp. (in: high G+C Gram-positive bacteria) TaxID=84139 RepID=UPI0039E66382
MDVTSDGLRTLTAVVHEGTFDAAAAALGLTPSAVSQRIKALEQAVGRVLVQRTKPVRATVDGEVLLRLGRQWRLLVDEARAELVGPVDEPDDPRDRVRIPVRIGCNADSLATWFLPVVAEFHRAHPVNVEVQRDDESVTADLLRSGDVLGAVTSAPLAVRGCRTLALGSLRYFPAASPWFVEHWLGDEIRPADLARAPMMMFDRNDAVQRRTLRQLAGPAADPDGPPISLVPAAAEYRRAIQAGMGWGAIPAAELDDPVTGAGLVRLSGEPVDVPLFWQHWALRSPLLGALTGIVVDHAARALIPPQV